MIDPFHDVRDKRMSELSPEQQERAAELWLRTNCSPRGSVGAYWWGHLQTLFRIIDRLRHEAEADEMRDALLRNGFVECDIPACNCGSWHHRYGLPERMREIEFALADAGHELSNDNGHSILRALNALIARLDAAERENERLRAENDALTADALRYRWLRGREDGRYMTVYAFRTDVDEVCLGEELDAAIDAAIAAEQSEK